MRYGVGGNLGLHYSIGDVFRSFRGLSSAGQRGAAPSASSVIPEEEKSERLVLPSDKMNTEELS